MKACRIGTICFFTIFLTIAARQGNGQTPDPLEENEQVVISPKRVDFGSQAVGVASVPRTVTLTNNSISPLTLHYILTSGIDFAQTNTCGSTLASKTSCTIGVTFRPAISGSRIGTLILSTSAPHNPQHVDLTGFGEERQ